MIARYKHSSLFGLFNSNEEKKFYNIVTWREIIVNVVDARGRVGFALVVIAAQLGEGRVRGERRHPVATPSDKDQRFPDEEFQIAVVEVSRQVRPVQLKLCPVLKTFYRCKLRVSTII